MQHEFDTMGKSKKMFDMIKICEKWQHQAITTSVYKRRRWNCFEKKKKKHILNRWREYGAQLFERPKQEEPLVEEQIPPNEQETPPLLSEVEHAVRARSRIPVYGLTRRGLGGRSAARALYFAGRILE